MVRISSRYSLVVSSIIIVTLFSSSSRAEVENATAAGDRVRVEYQERGRKWFLSFIPYTGMKDYQSSGLLLAISSDSIAVRDDVTDSALTVSRENIKRIDISIGSRRRTLEGLGYGASIGSFIAYGYLAGYRDYEDAVKTSATTELNRAGAILGISTLVGGIIGYLVKTDRWKRAQIEELTISADLDPGLQRPSVTFTLRF